MIFQILDANYTYDSQKRPLVQLFGETEDGKSVTCKVAGFRPYFYAGVKEGALDEVTQDLIEMGLEVEQVDRFEPIGYQVVPTRMLKITTKDPKEVRSLRDRVRELPGVKAVYETDILFRNRFLIDRGLGGMGWAEAKLPEWVSGQEPPLINLDSLIPMHHDANAPLRYMSFDIECLPNHGEMPKAEVSPVILISMAFEPEYKGQRDLVLVGKNVDCTRPDVQVCQDEHDLLSTFASILRDYDPDVVAGYNSNEFDFPYLLERAKQLRVDLRTGRDGSSCYQRKIVNSTNISITGRVVVDLLPIIRSSYSLKQYTLRNASAELLKMEKYDVDPKEIESLWAEGGEGLRRFISYSRRDAILAQRLLLDLKLMDKYIALSRASGALLQDIVNGGQSGMVENLLLRRFGEVSRVVSPKPDIDVANDRYFEKPQNYTWDQFNSSSAELSDEMRVENNESDELKGGAVLVPEKGLLEDLVILDYKSLYPTIMMAHNLCYSTVVPKSQDLASDKTITAPSGGKFVSHDVSPGIMPQVLRELLDQRTETKRLMKSAGEEERRFLDAKQYAIKILLNSFYGYSGYARARLYSLTLANAVTSFGRENILRTKKVIDDIGTVYVINGDVVFKDKMIFGKTVAKGYDLSVVYGDTDSVFVRLKPSEPGAKAVSLDDAKLIGKKIAETVTSSLPQPMELVFEAFARRAIFLLRNATLYTSSSQLAKYGKIESKCGAWRRCGGTGAV